MILTTTKPTNSSTNNNTKPARQCYFLIQHVESRKEVPLFNFLKHLNNQSPNCDGGFEHQYYTFSPHGMQIFIEHLKRDAKMTKQSLFLDVGSGRGNTVFCVANAIKPVMSYGIEGDIDRYRISEKIRIDLKLPSSAFQMNLGKEVLFIYSAIADLQLKSFDPFTHVFIFAFGYKNADIENTLDLLLSSSSVTHLIIGKDINQLEKTARRQVYLDSFTIVEVFNVILARSKENHAIYIYKRNNAEINTATPNLRTSTKIWISSRNAGECFCDNKLEDFILAKDRKRRIISCSDEEEEEHECDDKLNNKKENKINNNNNINAPQKKASAASLFAQQVTSCPPNNTTTKKLSSSSRNAASSQPPSLNKNSSSSSFSTSSDGFSIFDEKNSSSRTKYQSRVYNQFGATSYKSPPSAFSFHQSSTDPVPTTIVDKPIVLVKKTSSSAVPAEAPAVPAAAVPAAAAAAAAAAFASAAASSSSTTATAAASTTANTTTTADLSNISSQQKDVERIEMEKRVMDFIQGLMTKK